MWSLTAVAPRLFGVDSIMVEALACGGVDDVLLMALTEGIALVLLCRLES